MTDSRVPDAARQQQFLNVVSRNDAERSFRSHLKLAPLEEERVAILDALDRILAETITSPVDVPAFDRSNVDGFAIRADDSYEAMEESPRFLKLNDEVLAPGEVAKQSVQSGFATTIATGGILPRGADAVVMVEDTDVVETEGGPRLQITRAVNPGQNITYAGTDIARGETVLRRGQHLSSRELGVIAAVGLADVAVYRKPKVAIISTGNEIVAPGTQLTPGAIYDSNQAILSAAVKELGGESVPLGIVNDDEAELERIVQKGLEYDVVVLSGGTSKGAGDLSYRVVSRLVADPGIVAHGVALKPGKPVCLAATNGKPVVILPGFPTSAVFTFHEFVAPVIRLLGGRGEGARKTLKARVPTRINSDRGRTEYSLVNLIPGEMGFTAYPMGKGSGSVTTFSMADGFFAIDAQTEIVQAGETVEVQLLSETLNPADLVVIGSHCVGLDLLLGILHEDGFSTKSLFVGSMGGLAAVKRGECDVAGLHLFDPRTAEYNRPFLTDDLELAAGYRRQQCLVFRNDDARFLGAETPEQLLNSALREKDCTMVNRNAGSGTRVLLDELLAGARPPGYALQPKSHNAVSAAIAQGRADWGVAIRTVAENYGLACLPMKAEHYDFAIPKNRLNRPAVQAFLKLLQDPGVRGQLQNAGFEFG